MQWFPATKTYSITGPIAVANSIKTSVATVASPATYITTALNGAIGTAVMAMPRTIRVTLSSAVGSYVNASTIVITGKLTGVTKTETLTIVGADGGTTLTTTGFFDQVTQIDVDAQVDTSGAFLFGTYDARIPGGAKWLRFATTGNAHVAFTNGTTDTIPAVAVGEIIPAYISTVFGDSTVQNLTAYV